MKTRAMTALLCILPMVGCAEDRAAAANSDGPTSVMIEGALSRQDALQGLNENMPSIVPCTQATGGQFVLLLSWKVQPDGSVSAIDVSRDGGEIDVSLQRCVSGAMQKWRFPKSKIGTRIEQVPVKVGVEG